MEKKKYLKIIILIIFILTSLLTTSRFIYAANFYFSPSIGSHTVGATFSVNVYLSSPAQAMNAASGIISFPKDKLEVISLSKTGSIFTLWVSEPSFSNSTGTVNFEGIVLNPGFSGSNGKVITINFKTKIAGNAPLTFSSGSVLASDGQGTNILMELGNANFQIGIAEPEAPEIIIPSEIAGTPIAPTINSSTHPDPNKWYREKDAKFNWNIVKDIIGTRLILSKILTTIPTSTYTPPIHEHEFNDIPDGKWYFSVRLQNDVGWGAISRFRFQIDTQKPTSFEISEIIRKDLTNPKVSFNFDAKDKTSGIDYYEVQINEGDSQIWKDDGSGIYETPIQGPGKHTLIAKAFDRAGNSLANSIEFEIEALESPVITEYPKQLASGDTFVIKGTSKYPNAQTIILFEKDGQEIQNQIVKNEADGSFMFIVLGKFNNGIYKVSAIAVDEREAKSFPSEEVVISIERPAFLRIGSWVVSLLAVLIPIVALIFAFLFIIWYGWHKFLSFRKRIHKKTKEAKESLHQAFIVLKKEVERQVAKLDSNPDLNEREKEIYDSLKKTLKKSEEFIGKEIEDIEKEIDK